MKRICLCAYCKVYYNNDKIFDPLWMNQLPLGENWGFFFHDLREKLKTYGWDISTDMSDFDSFDKFLFFDMPSKKEKFWGTLFCNDRERYLVQMECQPIIPENWYAFNYNYFQKIFTWSPELKGQKFIRYFWPNKLDVNPCKADFIDRKKLCVFIGGNKKNSSTLELYSERRRVIDWFENNHPEDFDFYGVGWDCSLYKKSKEALRNIGRYVKGQELRRIKDYTLYRGRCPDKREILNKYKFSFCCENMRDIPGYITEKIFDCFSSGIVPVYMGWKGITEYLPSNTFIDARDFKNYSDLHKYLSNVTEEEYNVYLDNADSFLKSDDVKIFSGNSFVDKLIKGLGIS